jgi:hypothetical protein
MLTNARFSAFFASAVLLTVACGDTASAPDPESTEDPASRPVPAESRRAEENPALGWVRWEGHEQRFSRLTCDMSAGDYLIRVSDPAFRFRVGFRGEESGTIDQVDFGQSRDVEMIVGDGPRMERDSYIVLGDQGSVDLEASPQGARGTAQMLPGTGDAMQKHPDGLEVEFELNCP